MRRWFLALVALLVAAQLSWAGAALCCVDELTDQPSGSASLLAGEQAHASPAAEAHPVCETGHCHCHHAGCATPVAEPGRPVPPQALAPAPAEPARPRSHIPAGLERPNWLRA
jgi:hypothetical protein